MSFKSFLRKFTDKYFFNLKWRCNVCGKEIFEGQYFCRECEEKLPLNVGPFCNHCGRHTVAPEEYCSTCKEFLLSVDVARSAFVYDDPVKSMITKLKYGGKRYFAEILGEYLAAVYYKFGLEADVAVFIPMTRRAKFKRGFNQSELLAERFSTLTGVEVKDCLIKVKETPRQATLDRKSRMTNLVGAFKVSDKSAVKDKKVLIVDDVTTTGATAEALASKLKKAGAAKVTLLTCASVPPKNGY